jgi:hypothetical protein
MKQRYIAHLQQEIVQVFGHPVLSASNCQKLAEEIFEKTGMKISVNTLRRFFNLITAKYPPSYNTLTILSKACGFSSFNEFVQAQESKTARVADQTDSVLLNYMVSLFQVVPVASMQDETYRSLVRLTITFIISNQDIADAFQKKVARTKNGQGFYYEYFINTDYLARFYGEGLRYYLNEKREPEAQLFGHSLLCFRYWLTADDAGFNRHYKYISSHPRHQGMPPALQARYLSAQLFHAHIHQMPIVSILEEARTAYSQLPYTKESAKAFPQFEAVFTAALVLTHQFEEAFFYIGQAGKRKSRYMVPEEALLFRNFEVYEALAWAVMEKWAKAEALYERLRTTKFYFLEQQYLSILMLYLGRLLKKKRFHTEELVFLVEETGFRRFIQWL